MGEKERDEIRILAGLGLKARLLVWARMRSDDIVQCLGLGLSFADLSIPVSFQQIRHKLKRDPEWVLQTITACVREAQDRGLSVCVGLEDASRADRDFLMRVVETAQHAGAVRVRFADTVGIMEPFGVLEIMQTLRANTDPDIEMHPTTTSA